MENMLLVFLEGFNRRTPSAYIVLVFSRLKFPHGVTLCSARPMSVMAAAENKSAGLSGTFLRQQNRTMKSSSLTKGIVNLSGGVAVIQHKKKQSLQKRTLKIRNMDFIECWVYAILKEQLPEVFICYDNIPCEQQE
ncbi:hypothetical protein QYF36_020300 [Acer negundo]|nr:hypothetical protein QYF36_020300 [Acer negundo]